MVDSPIQYLLEQIRYQLCERVFRSQLFHILKMSSNSGIPRATDRQHLPTLPTNPSSVAEPPPIAVNNRQAEASVQTQQPRPQLIVTFTLSPRVSVRRQEAAPSNPIRRRGALSAADTREAVLQAVRYTQARRPLLSLDIPPVRYRHGSAREGTSVGSTGSSDEEIVPVPDWRSPRRPRSPWSDVESPEESPLEEMIQIMNAVSQWNRMTELNRRF